MRSVFNEFQTFHIYQVNNGLKGQSGNEYQRIPSNNKKMPKGENIFDKLLNSSIQNYEISRT